MIDIVLWLISTVLFLAVSGGLAALGIIGTALGLFGIGLAPVLIRYAGVVLLALCAFGSGVRTAGDQEAARNALQVEKNKVASLERDIGNMKATAAWAAAEREKIATEKAQLDKKVADYEQELNDKRAAGQHNACLLDDRDIRALDSLRNRPRR